MQFIKLYNLIYKLFFIQKLNKNNHQTNRIILINKLYLKENILYFMYIYKYLSILHI